ncbi:tRNA-dihydrouridine(20a/20b) synthase [NAD(P)+]-like protein [Modicella reniformis]|uniref:tRNA-dihydrouridine(20a/20b) synthase [NAD(P)+]-like protein n=1 Tax=Modicella reniformis TaxID=1440133 RepID=A0A9P6LRC4_9FUNG|nr:tRNA-dihydrouridine(20a/20b) synthase [NAD(P)+]-like protein [Modicella reniformis]
MIRMTKARVDLPCSIKIRIHKDLRETEEFVRRALSVGVDFITVHGRTRRQKSTESVSIEGMKLVKEVSTVPVLANGDVFSIEDANRIVEATGVDGTMAARGILENPALFAGYSTTPWECVETYVDLALSYGTNAFIFHHHLMYMFERSMSNAERRTFNSLTTIPSILDYLEEHYDLDIARMRAHRAAQKIKE